MRTYSIINISDITENRLSKCRDSRGNPCNMDVEHLRKSLDETKAIIKWDDENPAWVSELGLTVYTGGEMLTFLNGNVDWQSDEGEA